MKDTLIKQIEEVFSGLMLELSNLKQDEINLLPFEGSWSAGQLTQHLILSGRGMEKLIHGPEADANRPMDQKVAGIKAMLESKEQMKSPSFIDPEIKDYDVIDQTEKIDGVKIALLAAIEKNDLAKLATGLEFPDGFMTKYEAANFVIFHTQRHVKQLRNIIRHVQES